jgi:NAD+ diphosphatase
MRNAETVAFGSSGLERAAALRDRPDAIAGLWATGTVLLLWRGKPLFRSAAGLGWVASDHPVVATGSAPVFLGMEGAQGVFAVDLSSWEPETGEAAEQSFFDPTRQNHPGLAPDLGFEDLRSALMRLSPREAELAATGRAVLHWHQSHGFCAACGAASQVVKAGWQRQCPACGTQHFPRTDPVVIMLVTHGNQLLLGRNAAWPEGMYSLLAGFVEPGETLEAAVRREVFEEAGVPVGAVTYLASQPWPFPASLMLGAHGLALDRAITLDPVELQDALWVSRETLTDIFAGTHPQIRPPRPGAIASFLMRNWLADCLE